MTTAAEARAFLENIQEGSPEQDSLIWYENALPIVRLVAFIKLDTGYDVPLITVDERAATTPPQPTGETAGEVGG